MAETDKKLVGIFTLQHNETFYLPIWVKWYSKDIPNEDMYILAHNSNEEMEGMLQVAEKDGLNVTRLTTEAIFDHDWLNEQVHTKQRELLEKYKYVIYVDCDELIAPKEGTLREFLENGTEQAYRCDGWELHGHNMYSSIGFCKTSISSIPLTYTHGYHAAIPEFPIDTRLVLYHIHKINYQKAWERNQIISQETWDPYALANGLGTHNHIGGEQDFKDWFYRDVPYQNQGIEPVPIEILNRIYY